MRARTAVAAKRDRVYEPSAPIARNKHGFKTGSRFLTASEQKEDFRDFLGVLRTGSSSSGLESGRLSQLYLRPYVTAEGTRSGGVPGWQRCETQTFTAAAPHPSREQLTPLSSGI